MKDNKKYHFFWGSYFSNWYPCTFEWENVEFNCSEQAMMFAKALTFNDVETAEKIMAEKEPSIQKRLGKQVKNYDDSVWSKERYEIVKDICRAKFSQNPELREFLVAHKDYEIVEASPYDRIWGIGYGEHDALILKNIDDWGENLLGKLLTELANEL